MKHGAKTLGLLPEILASFIIAVKTSAGDSFGLASELFEEQDWISCRREALRALSAEPGSERATFPAAAAKLRISDDATARKTLERLASEASDPAIRARAAYELGRWFENQKQTKQAAKWFETVFVLQGGAEIGKWAGCALYRLMRADDTVLRADSPVRPQVATLSPTWAAIAIQMDKGISHKTSRTSHLGLWIVRLYRSQIRPAIGARCSLEPSCSEYFARALRRHGLLAFPIMADRLVREPSVVQAWEYPIEVHGQKRCQDRVEWHTYWFTGEGEPP